MILWRPFRWIFIPKHKYLFAYRISIAAEIQFLIFVPVSIHIPLCYNRCAFSSPVKILHLPDISCGIYSKSCYRISFDQHRFSFAMMAGNSFCNDLFQKSLLATGSYFNMKSASLHGYEGSADFILKYDTAGQQDF